MRNSIDNALETKPSKSSKKKHKSKLNKKLSAIDWKQEAEHIHRTVHDVCCFGSFNIEISAYKNLCRVIQKVDEIFSAPKGSDLVMKIAISSYRKTIEYMRSMTIYANAISAHKTHNPLLKERIVYLPLEFLVSIIPLIKEFFPKFELQFSEAMMGKLPAILASYHNDFISTKEIVEGGFHRDLYLNEIRYNPMLQEGLTQKSSPEEREFFFRQTVYYFQTISLQYGWGNCGHMADCAFLEAVYRGLPCTYFRLEGGGVEELNSIALGKDFPNPGAVVVSPWFSKPFVWNGLESFCKEQDIDRKLVIVFKVTNPEELKKFKKILNQENYPDWSQNITRTQNLKFIKAKSEIMEKVLIENGYVEVTEKMHEKQRELKYAQLISNFRNQLAVSLPVTLPETVNTHIAEYILSNSKR